MSEAVRTSLSMSMLNSAGQSQVVETGVLSSVVVLRSTIDLPGS